MNTAPANPVHDPVLLDPHHEHVIDGAHLTLQWVPARKAERYRVQIALDQSFTDVVYEEDVAAEATTLVVHQHFPDDDRTFFWRVLAGTAQGWSEGETYESFISGRADQVGRFADPDEAEPLGPLGALFSSATREAYAETHPRRRAAIEKGLGDPAPTHVEEAEVLSVEWVLGIAAAVAVLAILVFLFTAC